MENFSKIGKQNRLKGSTFERKVSYIINESLGWNLVRNLEQSRRDIHGDLVDRETLHAPMNLTIECKNRDFSIENAFHGNKPGICFEWLNEAHSKCPGRNVLLVFKNQRTNMIYTLFHPVDTIFMTLPVLCDTVNNLLVWRCGDIYFSTLQDILGLFKCLLNNLRKK